MDSSYQEKYIDEGFKHLNQRIDHNRTNQQKYNDKQSEVLAQILEQVKRTNGRVNKLEDETVPVLEKAIDKNNSETMVVRYLTKNPRIFILAFLGVSSLYIEDIRQPFFALLKKLLGL